MFAKEQEAMRSEGTKRNGSSDSTKKGSVKDKVQTISEFNLVNEKLFQQGTVIKTIEDDDVKKLERLQLINASARYELLQANQMLIDFHLNSVMRARTKPKEYKAAIITEDEKFSQMYNPHLVMQQRLNEMSPMMFGGTLRLPINKF